MYWLCGLQWMDLLMMIIMSSDAVRLPTLLLIPYLYRHACLAVYIPKNVADV